MYDLESIENNKRKKRISGTFLPKPSSALLNMSTTLVIPRLYARTNINMNRGVESAAILLAKTGFTTDNPKIKNKINSSQIFGNNLSLMGL